MITPSSRIDEFIERMYGRSGMDQLAAHLESRYGIQVARLTELDLGVFRVDRRDGPSWVARIFAAARPVDGVEATPRFCASWTGTDSPPNAALIPTRSPRTPGRACW